MQLLHIVATLHANGVGVTKFITSDAERLIAEWHRLKANLVLSASVQRAGDFHAEWIHPNSPLFLNTRCCSTCNLKDRGNHDKSQQ